MNNLDQPPLEDHSFNAGSAAADSSTLEQLAAAAALLIERLHGNPGSNSKNRTAAQGLYDMASFYAREGLINESAHLYRRLIALLESADGKKAEPQTDAKTMILNHAQPEISPAQRAARAEALSKLGYARLKQDSLQDAQQYLELSLAQLKTLSGSQSQLMLAECMSHLGELYCLLNDFEPAQGMHLQAREILERHLGAEHFRVAISLNKLADVYCAKGDYTQAESACRAALSILDASSAKAVNPPQPKEMPAAAPACADQSFAPQGDACGDQQASMLHLLARGAMPDEISSEMNLTTEGQRTLINKLLLKLGQQSPQAAAAAIRAQVEAQKDAARL